MALYFLVSMVVLDILHPLRFEHRVRPDALVKVLDALGKYHDFPWAAFENMDVRQDLELGISFLLKFNFYSFRHSMKNISSAL